MVPRTKLYVCNELFDFVQNGTYGKFPISYSSVRRIREVSGSDESRCGPDRVTAFRTTETKIFWLLFGEECRGVGTLAEMDGRKVYQFEIRGKKGENAPVYFMYL